MAVWGKLGVIVAGLFAAYLVFSVATVGIAIHKHRLDSRQAQARERVREELFERQEQEEPDWEGWIDSLSATEREMLEVVVKRYLRLVTGSQEATLLVVADALDLGPRADAKLDQSTVLPRLQALATLSMLSYPLSIDRLEATCMDTQRVREATARLLHERREEFTEPNEWGTKFLIWEGKEPLSVYGLDTLGLLNTGSETPLFSLTERGANAWNRAVLVQVCRVLEQTQTVDPEASFDWLLPLLNDANPTVRAAAVRALTPHGWRDDLRDSLDIEALTDDPAPQVRRATYDVLEEWGDESARRSLLQAVSRESDLRCQLDAVRSVAVLDIDPPIDSPDWPAAVWKWVQAEREIKQDGAVSE